MEQDSSKYLSEARKQMVEQRHHIIKYLASAYDREQAAAQCKRRARKSIQIKQSFD
jgi:hypothetical protein